MKNTMKALLAAGGALAAALGIGAATTPAQAQGKTITLCWAAWDPANALVELSKDFTAKTGIDMKFEFVPWPNYADRFLNELNSRGKLCDLIIGDSQWIGGAAENGHYVKLNDFFEKEGIKMDDFMPATVVGYSEWPKNTPNYWALPAMGDAVGWTYRKDWFARPELQKEFKDKYGRDLAAPKTLDELRDIAKFFQGREIDGKKVYGASIYTERGSEGITMGVTNCALRLRLQVPGPQQALCDGRLRQLAGRRQGARVLQGALQVLHAARRLQRLHVGRSRRLQVRPGGDADELLRLLPGPLQGPECRRRQDRLLRQSRRRTTQATQLGGQGISVVSYSDEPGRSARNTSSGSPSREVQKKWWALGGYSCAKSVLNDPSFPDSAPFAEEFLKSMGMVVKDFWAEPSYAQLLQADAEARA